MSFYKKLFCVLTIDLFLTTLAISSPFPRGCEVTGFGYSENFLVLNEKGDQAFYLIQNHSDKPIEMELVETKEVFMSPKLHSKLESSHWSAFASDVVNQHFKCYTQDKPNPSPQESNVSNAADPNSITSTATTVNCSDVLEVCEYPRVKFALSNMGSYWVSTNKDQGQVIKDAVAKGILLRW